MTVSELIKQLGIYPLNMRVLTLGYEGGLNDISIKTEDVVFDANDKDTWYIGNHEYAKMVDGNPEGVKCVIISRSR